MTNAPSEITQADVEARMNELGVLGYHSQREQSPEVLMECLDEIERITEGRKASLREYLEQMESQQA